MDRVWAFDFTILINDGIYLLTFNLGAYEADKNDKTNTKRVILFFFLLFGNTKSRWRNPLVDNKLINNNVSAR